MRIQFLIKENDRLKFKDSFVQVQSFIKKRLVEIGDVYFYENLSEVEYKVDFKKIIVLSNILNPIIDLEAIDEAVAYMDRNGIESLFPVGLIPGTQFDCLIKSNSSNSLNELVNSAKKYLFETQAIYNNQFNLYKYKRLKIFLGIYADNSDMAMMTIPEFIAHLEKEDVCNKMLSFYEDCKLVKYEKCPSCGGEHKALKNKMSQPMIGYIPNTKSFYYECRNCSLVYLSPCPHQDDIHKIYDEYDKQDFVVSLNNPYSQGKTRCDYSFISDHMPKRVKLIDIGGGIGKFSLFAKDYFKEGEITHCDFEIKKNTHLEEKGIKTKALNFLKEPIGEREYNFVTMWEVVEHITFEKLEYVFSNINKALEKDGIFIFSTPDYDSPLCQAYDFYSVCPPYHPLCFSKSWLKEYFEKKNDWEIIGVKSCSDFLEDLNMWMKYAEDTCPGAPVQGISRVIRELFSSDYVEKNTKALLEAGIGTEIIFALRKI